MGAALRIFATIWLGFAAQASAQSQPVPAPAPPPASAPRPLSAAMAAEWPGRFLPQCEPLVGEARQACIERTTVSTR